MTGESLHRDPVQPFSVAIVDEVDLVERGLRSMLHDAVERIETITAQAGATDADILLVDTFGLPEARVGELQHRPRRPDRTRSVVYTWVHDHDAIEHALGSGFSGWLSKALPAGELVDALRRVHAGEVVVSAPPPTQSFTDREPGQGQWPGRSLGLSQREAHVLALLCEGRDTREIAEALFLSVNSVKTHLRKLYRRIGARGRTEAVLWGVDHGFRPRSRSFWLVG